MDKKGHLQVLGDSRVLGSELIIFLYTYILYTTVNS